VTVQLARTTSPSGRWLRYVAPAVLVIMLTVVIGVVVTIPGRSRAHHRAAAVSQGAVRKLPPYWIVRPGDTLSQISLKTRLSVAQLQAFNPDADPNNLIPGQRLNLWRHPPVPRPPPPGPMFWTVRRGESFGSIAADTGINIITLEGLNPKLKPTTLQPGERVRLRR
jgi:LysM repeat protein